MKKLILMVAMTLMAIAMQAQNEADVENESKKYEAMVETAEYAGQEANIVKYANFILNSWVDKDEELKKAALREILLWAQGTPSYTFELNEELSIYKDLRLFGVYMASMARYCILNKDNNSANMQEAAIKAMIAYYTHYSSEKWNGKDKKKIRDFIKKRDAGSLRPYIEQVLNKK